MIDQFKIYAFYSNPNTLEELLVEGVDGIIVDWENKGKNFRQSIYNTQVNKHTVADLAYVAQQNPTDLICRINGPNHWSVKEIEQAIDLGATEILVPMIKNMEQVEFILEQVNGRIKIGLMLETMEAIAIVEQLNKLPICRFFVGLNDLAIQRKSRNIFLPFADGSIKDLRPKITKDFGIAGLTHPESGKPVPCSLLIKQMKNYRASFGFLRRSFYKDLANYSINEILTALRAVFNDGRKSTEKKLSIKETHLLSQELI